MAGDRRSRHPHWGLLLYDVAAHLDADGGAIVVINTTEIDPEDLSVYFLTRSERQAVLRKAPKKRANFAEARDFVRRMQWFFDRRTAGGDGAPSPAFTDFVVSTGGRPVFADGAALQFSISHSDGLTAVALRRHGRVGVDIEHICDFEEMHHVISRFFTREEQAQVGALSAEMCKLAFFQLWTRKEALAKAFSIPVLFLDEMLSIENLLPGDGRYIAAGDLGNVTADSFTSITMNVTHDLSIDDSEFAFIPKSNVGDRSVAQRAPRLSGIKTKKSRCEVSTCTLFDAFALSCANDGVDQAWKLWTISKDIAK